MGKLDTAATYANALREAGSFDSWRFASSGQFIVFTTFVPGHNHQAVDDKEETTQNTERFIEQCQEALNDMIITWEWEEV